MSNKLKYSGNICESGVLISFSGINLALDDTYKVIFSNLSNIPSSTVTVLNPTGFELSPAQTSQTLSTLFTSKSNISDNSSISLIGLSIFNSNNDLIYRDYKSISCENLCGTGIVMSPTPSVTPTITPTVTPTISLTPTITPTKTPAPSQKPLLTIKADFEKIINNVPTCNKVRIRAKAFGELNKTYQYFFSTDMTQSGLEISNPSGNITILENPTYVYTNITMPESCKDYVLEFGLSDNNNTVQSATVFRCGNC